VSVRQCRCQLLLVFDAFDFKCDAIDDEVIKLLRVATKAGG
jgi:hypothetical protein